jgi:hypothetical protein
MSLLKHNEIYTTAGQRKSRALFKETCKSEETPVAYLGRQPDDRYLSMRETFIEYCIDDPTEATFAEVVFGDVYFWEWLKTATWMEPYLEEWRTITDIKRKQAAFKTIFDEAMEGRSRYTAAKYLIEEPWKDKRDPKVKEKNKRTTEEAFSFYKDDVARLKDYMS